MSLHPGSGEHASLNMEHVRWLPWYNGSTSPGKRLQIKPYPPTQLRGRMIFRPPGHANLVIPNSGLGRARRACDEHVARRTCEIWSPKIEICVCTVSVDVCGPGAKSGKSSPKTGATPKHLKPLGTWSSSGKGEEPIPLQPTMVWWGPALADFVFFLSAPRGLHTASATRTS